MYELTLTTPSLLFSAVSLILLAYTNRFIAYAQLIRSLKAKDIEKPSNINIEQLENLRRRLYLIRSMQLFGIGSLLLCVLCTFLIYINLQLTAVYVFGIALVLLIISLCLSIKEILISTKALEIYIDNAEK